MAAQADSARDAGRLDEAAGLYQKALQLRPAWGEGWWALGTLNYDHDRYSEAAAAFRKLAAIAPKNGTARVMLGLCEFELGNDAAALRHIEQGKALGITNAPELKKVVLYHEGVLLQRAGKFQAAQAPLGQLCMEGAADDPLKEALGMVALRIRARQFPASESGAAQIVTRVGDAVCLSAQKKFDEARRILGEIVAGYPDYPNIHYAYGRLLLDANDIPTAVEQFKQEIANHPKDVVSRLHIAAAEYKVDSAAGLPYAREAVTLDPTAPFAHYLLGLLLLDTDDFTKAIPELEIARRAFPRDAKLHLALSAAYSRSGNTALASRERMTALRLQKTTDGNQEKPPTDEERINIAK